MCLSHCECLSFTIYRMSCVKSGRNSVLIAVWALLKMPYQATSRNIFTTIFHIVKDRLETCGCLCAELVPNSYIFNTFPLLFLCNFKTFDVISPPTSNPALREGRSVPLYFFYFCQLSRECWYSLQPSSSFVLPCLRGIFLLLLSSSSLLL